MAEVKIENLVKVFDDGTVAVNQLNLTVANGEFLVLLGPSGCGKTTTLRCVAGLEHQTAGDITIGDRLVNALAPGIRDIAFVFQFYALYPHLDAYSNIAFPLRATNVDKVEIDRRVQEVAGILRIQHILNKRPSSLPSGEQQRVALGRAIIRRPHVFLMDEPLTNLDAALRVDMRVELKHLQEEMGITMLYVTHDQTEAMSMGHRIAVMNLGVLQQVGTPLEIYQHPATLFVAGFIGDPPMNLVPVTLEGSTLVGIDNELRLAIDEGTANKVRQNMSSDQLVLGIRAEDIQLKENGDGDVHSTIVTRAPLGDQTQYAVTLNGQLLRITTEPTVYFDLNKNITLDIDRTRMHIFDAGTEQALT